MRTRKRIYRKFSYRECDAFAAFLRRQSNKGWHFKEWKMGLVFERGDKKDVVYDVQTFPEGSENNYRPAADEEYADFCEAAGWEFVDGQKRFCIFRKRDKTAVPIVTAEEKFQNVWMAERKQWLQKSLSYALIAGLCLCQYILWPVSAMSLYNNMILFIICIAVIRLLWCAADGAWLLQWRRRQEKKLAYGLTITYDRAGTQKHILVSLREGLCMGILFLLTLQAGYDGIALWFLVFAILCVGADALASYLRPDKETAWIMQFAALGISLVMVLGLTATVFFGKISDGRRPELENPPLIQKDYKEIQGTEHVKECFSQKSLFGEMFCAQIEYTPEDGVSDGELLKLPAEETEPQDTQQAETQMLEETNGLRYEIYRSSYPWIIDKTWNIETKGRKMEDCTAQWDAVYAGFWASCCYYVKYENAVWVITTGERLSEQQTLILREKLEKSK